jgi:hypothetical protein
VSSVVGACAVFAGGEGAGDQFGISPALTELVRNRTSRQIPKVLRIFFPSKLMGLNQSNRRNPLRDGGFTTHDKKLSSQRKAYLT